MLLLFFKLASITASVPLSGFGSNKSWQNMSNLWDDPQKTVVIIMSDDKLQTSNFSSQSQILFFLNWAAQDVTSNTTTDVWSLTDLLIPNEFLL